MDNVAYVSESSIVNGFVKRQDSIILTPSNVNPCVTLQDGERENTTKERNVEQKQYTKRTERQDKLSNTTGPRKHCYSCCLRKNWPFTSKPSRAARIRNALLCPPHGQVASTLTFIFTALLLWGASWAMLKDDALPGGNIFGIVMVYIWSIVGGAVMKKIRLPPLLGMLLVGFTLQNAPVINVARAITPEWSSALRTIALVVILTEAGVGLDYDKLKKMTGPALRLSVISCLVEAATIATAARLLFYFPWGWSLMLGFIFSAVSPAIIVPCMLRLQALGLGTNKGIPTLVIAGGTLDDAVAIGGFSIVLGITFSNGNLVVNILRGPAEILIGVLYGILVGFICWYIPQKAHSRLKTFRFLILLATGLFAKFAAKTANITGAGALAVLMTSFVAGHGWRRNGWPKQQDPIPVMFDKLWHVFEPLLFGLIGAQVNIGDLKTRVIGLGTAVIVIGLSFRTIATFFTVFGAGLSHKEKVYVTIAWLPKATVQAAIGSIPLEMARKFDAGPEAEEMGIIILSLAVYVILLTAPLGAILMSITAPCLLTREADDITTIHVMSDSSAPDVIHQSIDDLSCRVDLPDDNTDVKCERPNGTIIAQMTKL